MITNRFGLAVVLAIGSIVASPAYAISGCSNSTLNGNYAIQFSGRSVPTIAPSLAGLAVPTLASQSASQASKVGTPNSAVPADGIVHVVLDGNGLLIGQAAASLDGTWLQGNIAGQYSVSPDCSVSFSMSDPSGAAGTFAGVVVGQGDSVLLLQTDTGTGVTGILKKMRGICQTADLSGTFGFQYSGASVPYGDPSSSVGILTLDGQGNIAGAESRFSHGATSQVVSSGSITVNPDCSAVITLTSQGPAAQSLNFFAALTVDNKQLLLIQSDAGTAGVGSIISQ